MSRAAGLWTWWHLSAAASATQRDDDSSAAVQSGSSSRVVSFFGCLSPRGDKVCQLKWNKGAPRRQSLVEALACEVAKRTMSSIEAQCFGHSFMSFPTSATKLPSPYTKLVLFISLQNLFVLNLLSVYSVTFMSLCTVTKSKCTSLLTEDFKKEQVGWFKVMRTRVFFGF